MSKIRIGNSFDKQDTTMTQGWKPVRIGDICKTNQQTYSVSEKWSFVNYLDTGNITENRINEIQYLVTGKNTLPSRARRKVYIDDILYSTVRPNQRHYGIIKDMLPNMLVSTGFAVISVDKAVADSDFLYYYLSQDDVVENLHAIGEQSVSAYPSIKPSDIESLELMLPPLEEQREIGRILRVLDDKLSNNTAINHHLEQMAQAIFKSWFVDFEPFADSEFIDSEFGKIPMGWQVGTLSELITVKYGKDHKKLANGSIPVFGSGGIMRFVDIALYRNESVLIPRKGTLNNVIYVNQPFWSVDTMFYTEMNRLNLAKFVYFFVRSKDLASMNTGAAVPSMTTEILNTLPVVIPPDEELARFEEIVGTQFAQIQDNLRENDTLSFLRDTLLSRLMSGELSVANHAAK
ncbi:restriction endonuclease subunit S [Oxalobacter vibrioformis]|uniref:Restriction endonuclease subunit S n=1 Tax=Oxalobacter vibrioformis TaxID=933080 RepID=A0A9E9P482_9BURK|nr:restriction endonuclease subunit S [Oxalobacter vibrioformis]WAW10828.1 restriction endonuclease subunit S [Oxalobacter vibrioformis]